VGHIKQCSVDVSFITYKGKKVKMILTSFQDFPCAKRGNTGAFGLMKVTLFEWAMSFGCIITRKMCIVMLKHILVIHHGMQTKKLRIVKKTGSNISDPKIKNTMVL
jgi:hypothetical protein